MADEKACGVIIYKNENNTRKYVIIRGVGIYQGYYGFPKGHMEPGETEQIIKKERMNYENCVFGSEYSWNGCIA